MRLGRGKVVKESWMHGWVADVCSLLYLRESDASLWPALGWICNANASAQLPSGWTNLCSVADVHLLRRSDWRSLYTGRRQECRSIYACVVNVAYSCVFVFRPRSTTSSDCIVGAQPSEGSGPWQGQGGPRHWRIINTHTHNRHLDKRHPTPLICNSSEKILMADRLVYVPLAILSFALNWIHEGSFENAALF